jgi:predicted NUDIX family NTP pyrophosphohydrolase
LGLIVDEIKGNLLMARHSAGLLLYRRRHGVLEVLLAHPGGPFWAGKDLGAWSIPKGEYDPGEDPLAAARREFREETGFSVTGEFIPLTPRKQPSGKIIAAWAVAGDCDAAAIRSNLFILEWPPHSAQQQQFPEVDRGAWFALAEAKEKITKGQKGFLEELQALLET